jgi:hypothetical protein
LNLGDLKRADLLEHAFANAVAVKEYAFRLHARRVEEILELLPVEKQKWGATGNQLQIQNQSISFSCLKL